MKSGFYKYTEKKEFLYGEVFISTPSYELVRELKDTYKYPVDGWYWFESEELAREFFGLNRVDNVNGIRIGDSLVWTSFEFFNRFSIFEQNQIFKLSESDPLVKRFLFILGIATQVENNHPLTVEGVMYLTSIGVISEQRMQQILGIS